MHREPTDLVRDTITALAVCHNVTPVYPLENDRSVRDLQASSPDEKALVRFAELMDMKLIERDQNLIRITNSAGAEENYEVLVNFPFNSETKRMGLIVRQVETDKIIFYLKGAEVVLKQAVRPAQRDTIDEKSENLAIEGLRTLVIAQKGLHKEDYEAWRKLYEEAKATMEDREMRIQEVVSMLEKDLELLAITGVEDKLQDEV